MPENFNSWSDEEIAKYIKKEGGWGFAFDTINIVCLVLIFTTSFNPIFLLSAQLGSLTLSTQCGVKMKRALKALKQRK